MFTLLLAFLVSGSQVSGGEASESVSLHIRLYAEHGVDHETVMMAQDVADALMAKAGVRTTWRYCGRADPCLLDPVAGPDVVVLLFDHEREAREEDCGQASLGTRQGAGRIAISVPCVVAAVSRMARRGSLPSHPLLKMPKFDDLVGAILAHELGHVLGLAHGDGVMRACLGPDETIALRTGALHFSDRDAAQMKAALLSRQRTEPSKP